MAADWFTLGSTAIEIFEFSTLELLNANAAEFNITVFADALRTIVNLVISALFTAKSILFIPYLITRTKFTFIYLDTVSVWIPNKAIITFASWITNIGT